MPWLIAKVFDAFKKPKKMSYPQIIINTRKGVRFVKEMDIVACKADGNYTTLLLQDGKRHIISKKLKDIEEKLSKVFFRIHHSHMVNLQHLVSMKNGNDLKVILSEGSELEVSKRRKGEFLTLFKRL